MNAPFGRVGGKRRLKKRIISEFPPNYQDMTYVEPFVGAGSVFYGKDPSKKEVISDIDPAIATLHKGFKEYSHDLAGTTIQMSKQKFDDWKKKHPRTDKERFMKEFILSKFSFMANRKSYNHDKRNSHIRDYSDRLKDVVILNRNYEAVIKKYDSPHTLFYFDPPYQGSEEQKLYDFPAFDIHHFKALLDTIKGKFILSFNYNKETADLFKKYHQQTVQTRYEHPKRTVHELLVKNF